MPEVLYAPSDLRSLMENETEDDLCYDCGQPLLPGRSCVYFCSLGCAAQWADDEVHLRLLKDQADDPA